MLKSSCRLATVLRPRYQHRRIFSFHSSSICRYTHSFAMASTTASHRIQATSATEPSPQPNAAAQGQGEAPTGKKKKEKTVIDGVQSRLEAWNFRSYGYHTSDTNVLRNVSLTRLRSTLATGSRYLRKKRRNMTSLLRVIFSFVPLYT